MTKNNTMKKRFLIQYTALFLVLLISLLPVSFAVSINPASIAVATTATTANITFQTDVAAETSVLYGKSVSALQEALEGMPAAATHKITLQNLNDNERYYYQLKAQDSAGTFTSNYFQFYTLPETPRELALDAVEHNTATISWQEVSGRDFYNVYLNNNFHDVSSRASYTFEDLNYTTQYAARVTAVNQQHQESGLSTETSFTTGLEPFNISFIQVAGITNQSAVISWMTNMPAPAKVAYGKSANSLDMYVERPTHATQHALTLHNLDEHTGYYYKIISGETTATVRTFTTLSAAQLTEAVLFSNINVQDITMNSAELIWQTPSETKGMVLYSIDDSFKFKTIEQSYEVNHRIELKDLLSGMTYYFKIKVDNQESGMLSFNTSESNADFINLYETPSTVRSPTLNLRGETADKAKLYVFVNRQQQPRAQIMIDELPDTQFNLNVSLDQQANTDGIKGKNIVELFSWNNAGVKSTKRLEILLDQQLPLLTLNPLPTYVSQRKINISGLTNPKNEIEILLGESSQGRVLSDDNGYFLRELDVGTATRSHVVTIIARDQAGNENRFQKEIFVDNKNPTIQFFTSFAAPTHYKLMRIDAQTKPLSTITMQNFGEYTGCTDVLFLEKYGTCKEIADVYGSGPDQSISTALDPLNLGFDLGTYALGQRITAKADKYGNFTVLVPLFGPETDAYGETTKKIGTNTLIFNVTDQAGNEGTARKIVKYEPGCTDWSVGKVTSIPINIYTQDLKTDNIETSVIFELDYRGAGSPAFVNVALVEDTTGGQLVTSQAEFPKDGVINIPAIGTRNSPALQHSYGASFGGVANRNDLTSIGRYKTTKFDDQKRKVYVYAPVTFNKFSGQAEELPKTAGVYLDAKISYKDSLGNVANCDVYPVASYIIQKPEYVGKWFSPEMINQTIKLLDNTINITEKAVNITKFAARWTTVACGAMVAFNYLQGFAGQTSSISGTQCPTQLKSTYEVCDRILCPPIPPNCEGFEKAAGKDYSYRGKTADGKTFTVEYYNTNDEIANRRVSDIYNKDIVGCENSQDVKSVVVFKGLENGTAQGWSINGAKTSQSTAVYCSDKPKDQLNPPNKQDIPGCYKEGCTADGKAQFDETKCLFGKGYGLNPAEGLFSSLQCGCFTGAKAHLENLLKVLYAAKKCMQQAKIGETTSGYCERLMSYFVCDLLTEVFKFLFKSTGFFGRTATASQGLTERNLGNYKTNAQQVSESIQNRYGDIVKNRLGLSTDQLVNKVCVAAFAADWSILEGAIDQVVETIEVAPQAGISGTSRPYGFDPFTSRLNIGYNLYAGVVPGGETHVEAWLECDPNFSGKEYCPAQAPRLDLVRTGKIPSYLGKDDFFDENIFYIDQNAQAWYNKMVMTLTYTVGGKEKTDVIIKPVTKHGDINAFGCQFDIATGFHCNIGLQFQDLQGLFPGGVQLFNKQQGSKLIPSISTFFAGNQISALVKVKNTGQQQAFIRVLGEQQQEYALDQPQYSGEEKYYLIWLEGNTYPAAAVSTTTPTSIPPTTTAAPSVTVNVNTGTSQTLQRSVEIDILRDSNNNNLGDAKIYSGDSQQPHNQAFNFTFNLAANSPNNFPPAVMMVEPVSVLQQQPSSYVNTDNEPIPLGYVIVDDNNAVKTVALTITTSTGKMCTTMYDVDQNGVLTASATSTASASGTSQCPLEITSRSLGLKPQNMPPFIEFNLKKDGIIVDNDPDTMYDVTLLATDDKGISNNPAETKRLRIYDSQSTQQTLQPYAPPTTAPTTASRYSDMLLCLGSGPCSGNYGAGNTQVEFVKD